MSVSAKLILSFPAGKEPIIQGVTRGDICQPTGHEPCRDCHDAGLGAATVSAVGVPGGPA
jgi:hypothetical protein